MFFLSAWHIIGAQISWSASAHLLFTRSHRASPTKTASDIVLNISLQTESQFEVLAGLNSLCRARWSQIFDKSSWIFLSARIRSMSCHVIECFCKIATWVPLIWKHPDSRDHDLKGGFQGHGPHYTWDLLIHPWFSPVWEFDCVICGTWDLRLCFPL